jgi:hypothetical protein
LWHCHAKSRTPTTTMRVDRCSPPDARVGQHVAWGLATDRAELADVRVGQGRRLAGAGARPRAPNPAAAAYLSRPGTAKAPGRELSHRRSSPSAT